MNTFVAQEGKDGHVSYILCLHERIFINMNRLTRAFLKQHGAPAGKTACGTLTSFPEKIVQFGEGNFLRAFVDWKIDELNEKGLFDGQVLVTQPIKQGMAAE